MILLAASAALAGSWNLSHQVAVSWFPKGLRYFGTYEYRMPLPWKSDSVLFDDVYFAPGAELEVSPAYARAGGRFHFTPIAVLEIEGEALATEYFGTFSGVTDFDRPDADFSDEAFERPEVVARRHSGFGFRYGITPTLQAKVSHLIIAAPQEFTRFTMIKPDGVTGEYWYEPQYDALFKWDDTVMVNNAYAFWAFRESSKEDSRFFWVGAQFNHQLVFGTGDTQLKAGPMVVFKAGQSKWVPTAVVFVEAWIQSPIHPIMPPYLAAAAVWKQG